MFSCPMANCCLGKLLRSMPKADRSASESFSWKNLLSSGTMKLIVSLRKRYQWFCGFAHYFSEYFSRAEGMLKLNNVFPVQQIVFSLNGGMLTISFQMLATQFMLFAKRTPLAGRTSRISASARCKCSDREAAANSAKRPPYLPEYTS